MEAFDLERLDAPPGLACLHARARNHSGDERIFVVAEVRGRRHRAGRLTRLHLAAFESAFHDATRLLRTVLAERDPRDRLQWNRIFLMVQPEVLLGADVVDELVARLAPATRRLGLEKVIVRFSRLDSEDPEAGSSHQFIYLSYRIHTNWAPMDGRTRTARGGCRLLRSVFRLRRV